MTTEITTQTAGSGSLATLLVGSHLPLAAPTDITLTARNAQISGYQKSGADLSVRFADGNALQLQNFFVIGEQGDFSRLISASGAPLVTGLMGPEAESEPDEPQIAEAAIPSDAIEVFPNAALMSDAQSGAEATGAATPAPSGDEAPAGNMSVGSVSADGDSGGSWSQPTLLAGLGVASGLSLSSGGTDPSAATTSAASAGGASRPLPPMTLPPMTLAPMTRAPMLQAPMTLVQRPRAKIPPRIRRRKALYWRVWPQMTASMISH